MGPFPAGKPSEEAETKALCKAQDDIGNPELNWTGTGPGN
jgi:hypothetical protein